MVPKARLKISWAKLQVEGGAHDKEGNCEGGKGIIALATSHHILFHTVVLLLMMGIKEVFH